MDDDEGVVSLASNNASIHLIFSASSAALSTHCVLDPDESHEKDKQYNVDMKNQ